jgi:hypothetical protein
MADEKDNGKKNGKPSAGELSRAALHTVSELTGYDPEAVTGLAWDGDVWRITVDVLELERIPRTTDVIGSYEVSLDEEGSLRGYRRTRRFTRGQVSEQ